MLFWWGFFAKNFSTVDHLIVDYIVQNYPEQNSEATSLSRDCWKSQKEVPTLIIIIISRKKKKSFSILQNCSNAFAHDYKIILNDDVYIFRLLVKEKVVKSKGMSNRSF